MIALAYQIVKWRSVPDHDFIHDDASGKAYDSICIV